MKKLLLSLAGVALISFVFAQSKQLTVDDAVLYGKTKLAPKKLTQLSWIPGTNDFAFVDKQDEKESLLIGTAGQEKKSAIIDLNKINELLKAQNKESKDLTKFPAITWLNKNQFYFTVDQKIYTLTLDKKTLVLDQDYNKDAENTDFHAASKTLAYTIENNLFVQQTGKPAIAVTNESNKEILSGQAVHRNEFNINKGTFWSANANFLAFYKMDQSMVTDYPIYDLSTQPATNKMLRYPMSGMKSHEVKVGIYDVKANKTIYLNIEGPVDQYLTNLTWSPDEKQLYIAVLNRDQNHMMLNAYDIKSGNLVKTLFDEKNDKYVEPENGPVFLKSDPNKFLWFSKRDGFNHLYLYNTEGKLLKQETKGEWSVIELLGFDKKQENIYFISTKESPIERHVYSCNLKSSAINKLTTTSGTHTALLSESGEYFIDNVSSTTLPRSTNVFNTKGKSIQNLLEAENPLKDYTLGTMKLFKLKAEDNSDLYCRMILPPAFDSTKKYPVFVYLYGGPHVQLVNNTWLGGADLWLHYMATHGYVVFTLDNHGSGNRGQKFEQATFRQLGTVEVADQMKGIEYLKHLRYADTTRMVLQGWSFGGFMTTTIMTKHPDIFKAAVAGGPVIDWKYYEVMYTERYMDTPEQNPEGYEKANLLNYVDKLKGKLMLIHGTSDDVVLWQHSLMYLKKCVEKDIAIDYFVYPEHKHNVIGPDRVHLLKKITRYFDEIIGNPKIETQATINHGDKGSR